jgi:glycosyltransferase involved in cell wall biosynthesis
MVGESPDDGSMNLPLVSVVIPARNADTTIASQLEALSRQNYSGPWEVVVVNNGSTDDTARIVRDWTRKLPNLRLVNASEGVGRNYARNAGVAEARGDLLLFCDADDVATPGWMEEMVRASRSSDIVRGGVDHNALQNGHGFWHRDDPRLKQFFEFLPIADSANFAVRSEVLAKLGGWNENYLRCNDVEFSWRAQISGYSLGEAPRAQMMIRHRESLSSSARQAYATALEFPRLYKDFRGFGMPRGTMRNFAWDWARIVVGFLPYMLLGPRRRRAWVRRAAARVGRVRGSIRHRVLFL